MSELDQTVCWVPEGFDNRAVRKVQRWLNDHLGEQVLVCVRWRGCWAPLACLGPGA